MEATSATSARKMKAEQDAAVWARLKPQLAMFVHGRSQKLEDLAAEFEASVPEAKDAGTKKVFRDILRFEKPEGMKRTAWFVTADKVAELGLEPDVLVQLALSRPDQAATAPQPKKTPLKKQPPTRQDAPMGPFMRIHHE